MEATANKNPSEMTDEEFLEHRIRALVYCMEQHQRKTTGRASTIRDIGTMNFTSDFEMRLAILKTLLDKSFAIMDVQQDYELPTLKLQNIYGGAIAAGRGHEDITIKLRAYMKH